MYISINALPCNLTYTYVDVLPICCERLPAKCSGTKLVLNCRIEVLRQALKSKSRWWRKCPIQISSGSKSLLNSEGSFALFAEGSAAKEQWFTALKQASSGKCKPAVEDAYARFCQQVRESRDQGNDYPQVTHFQKPLCICFNSVKVERKPCIRCIVKSMC